MDTIKSSQTLQTGGVLIIESECVTHNQFVTEKSVRKYHIFLGICKSLGRAFLKNNFNKFIWTS